MPLPRPKRSHSRCLVNQDLYDKAVELNLKSDISRYEFLMLFGGVYVDADSECFRHIDFLIHESIEIDKIQAIGFLGKDEKF
jgi:mannosyltransferase OCH1-like enzyme